MLGNCKRLKKSRYLLSALSSPQTIRVRVDFYALLKGTVMTTPSRTGISGCNRLLFLLSITMLNIFSIKSINQSAWSIKSTSKKAKIVKVDISIPLKTKLTHSDVFSSEQQSYYHRGLRKPAKIHTLEAGIKLFWHFFIKINKLNKNTIDYQKCCWLIFCQLTNQLIISAHLGTRFGQKLSCLNAVISADRCKWNHREFYCTEGCFNSIQYNLIQIYSHV